MSQKTMAQAKSQLSCLVSRVDFIEGALIFMIGLDPRKCQADSGSPPKSVGFREGGRLGGVCSNRGYLLICRVWARLFNGVWEEGLFPPSQKTKTRASE
jgi:hypothetical protein